MSVAMISIPTSLKTASFPTELGWMAMQVCDQKVVRIWFGFDTRQAVETKVEVAMSHLNSSYALDWCDNTSLDRWIHPLQDFAAGERVSFSRWTIETSHLTPFQQSVVSHCRRIPRGKTLSYGELAERAGSPRAARAVGSVMSSNRVPIVVPCHRVVGASGSLGGYSSPRGLDMKRQLLDMEGASLHSGG